MTDITISSGVTSSGLTVSSGFDLQVQSGGFVQKTTVLSGGTEHIDGVASGSLVSYGGVETVDVGGMASGTTITGFDPNTINNIIVGQIVSGTAVGTIVDAFAEQDISSGGVASGSEINLFGSVEVRAGGTAIGTLIGPGGLYVLADGKTSNTQVLTSGTEEVEGGTTRGTILSSRSFQNVFSGGASYGTVVNSGGVQQIFMGGLASGSIVSRGGVLSLDGSLGVVASGTLLRGGAQTIMHSAQAHGTIISGGYEYVFGESGGTTVRSGGHEQVAKNGIASGLVVSNGGHAGVGSGGELVKAKIFNGATVVVSSGGTVASGLTIHAGSATIDGTMAAGQTASFAGTAGMLKLDNLAAFGAAISGFGGASEKVDLGGFAFGASETATWSQTGTSGTLTVHDGATSGSLTLIGAYATGDFQLSTDGHGGTLIKDPTAPAAVPATRFTQAVAGLEGGRFAAGAAAVRDRGSALLGASPLVGIATSGH